MVEMNRKNSVGLILLGIALGACGSAPGQVGQPGQVTGAVAASTSLDGTWNYAGSQGSMGTLIPPPSGESLQWQISGSAGTGVYSGTTCRVTYGLRLRYIQANPQMGVFYPTVMMSQAAGPVQESVSGCLQSIGVKLSQSPTTDVPLFTGTYQINGNTLILKNSNYGGTLTFTR